MKNAQQLTAIRQEMEKALLEVAKKHGITNVKLGAITHDNDGFRTKLEVQYDGGESADMKTLKYNAPIMGFKPEIAGATIEYSGKECKVVGMKRTKMLLDIKGKIYTASIDDVKRVLKMQKSQYVA